MKTAHTTIKVENNKEETKEHCIPTMLKVIRRGV